MRAGRTLKDRLVVAVAIVLAWQLATFTFGAHWVTPPLATAGRFFELTSSGDLPRHALFTLIAAAGGFLVGGIPGVVIPFGLRRAPRLAAILDPYFVAAYGTPKLALAPLFILWFGIGLTSKIVLVASVVFFLILFGTAAGVRDADVRLVAMARVAGASEAFLARHVVWPGAVPYIFAALKISLSYAIGAAVVGELISSNRGLGYLIQAASQDFDTATVFAGLIAVTMLVLVVNAVVDVTERRLLSWRPVDARTEPRLVPSA
jgi:NitT/TauT family transport system permease protein